MADKPTLWRDAPLLLPPVHAFIGVCHTQASLCAAAAQSDEGEAYRLAQDIDAIQERQRAGWRERTWSSIAATTTHLVHSYTQHGMKLPTTERLMASIASDLHQNGSIINRHLPKRSAFEIASECERYGVFRDALNLLLQLAPDVNEPLPRLSAADVLDHVTAEKA